MAYDVQQGCVLGPQVSSESHRRNFRISFTSIIHPRPELANYAGSIFPCQAHDRRLDMHFEQTPRARSSRWTWLWCSTLPTRGRQALKSSPHWLQLSSCQVGTSSATYTSRIYSELYDSCLLTSSVYCSMNWPCSRARFQCLKCS